MFPSLSFVCLSFFAFFCTEGTDWVNPDDPNVQAENELLAAASAIEAAAKKLTALRPREEARVSYYGTQNAYFGNSESSCPGRYYSD